MSFPTFGSLIRKFGKKHAKLGYAEITSNTLLRFTLDSFLTFINQFGVNFGQDRTLLTVSGGIDSVVLANLFYKMGFKAGIAHCNFGLRGEESDEDEQFVRSLAEQYNFEFFVKGFDVKAFMEEQGVSTQMAARELRYKWFEEIRQSNNYRWIATAHQANDSFESVLLNLARGTGLPGLHGISGINGALIRPLLYASKVEIQQYAAEQGLQWREDRSNDSDSYKRNLLRHHAVPVFKKINPSLEATFRTTSERLASADYLLEEFLENWESNVVRNDAGIFKIDIDKVTVASEPHYRLWFILNDYGFTYSQVGQILHSINGISGKIFFSTSHRLLVDREELILEKRDTSANVEWVIEEFVSEFKFEDKVLCFEHLDRNSLSAVKTDGEIIHINTEHLIFPLTIRRWRRGDKFHPFGMHGRQKKVSDLFTDLKLNRFEKEEVRILVNGNDEIIWVIGLRLDERFKVEKDSENIMRITLQNDAFQKKF